MLDATREGGIFNAVWAEDAFFLLEELGDEGDERFLILVVTSDAVSESDVGS